jgi:hypothetical protein
VAIDGDYHLFRQLLAVEQYFDSDEDVARARLENEATMNQRG